MDPRDEALYKAGRAGVSFMEVNTDFLHEHDWSKTCLGPREEWQCSLISLVNLMASFPHPAAIFWKSLKEEEFVTIHNLSFGKEFGNASSQGLLTREHFSNDTLDALNFCLRGRTLEVAYRKFLPDGVIYAPESPVLLSPLLDEHGKSNGVLAQVMLPRNLQDLETLEVKKVDKDTDRDCVNPKVKESKTDSELDGDPEENDLTNNKLFRSFAQMLPTGLAVLNPDAEALFVNQEFFSLTSDRENSPKNFRAWPESIHKEDYERVMKAYRNAFTRNESLRVEFRCARGQNDPWRLFLMKNIEEQPNEGAFICAVIDITEIKAAELSQRRAAQEARERKDQQERFIDMVSHEIRNPLSAVLHSAEEIKDAVASGQEHGEVTTTMVEVVLEAVDTILLCVAHQSTLVDDILSFSKLDAMMLTLNPKKSQPKEALAECLKLFQPELRAKKIEFEYVLDVSFVDMSVDWVLADLKRIKQILVNLVTNAIKFTAKSQNEKKITVAVGASASRPTSYPPNVVFFDPDDKQDYRVDSTLRSEWGETESMYLMVAIKDTGIGISAANQARLFERFRQATVKTQENYGGSGLGLFISRKLCQLHGGDVGVASAEGSGSTFGFFFKARRSEPPNDGDDSEEAMISLSDKAEDLLSKVHAGQDFNLENEKHAGYDFSTKIASEMGKSRPTTLPSRHTPTRGYTDSSLNNPPVRLVAEAHPSVNADDRYEETAKIASAVSKSNSADEAQKDTSTTKSKDEVSKIEPESSHSEKSKPSSQKSSDAVKRPTMDTPRSLLLVEDNQINQKVLGRQLTSRGFDVTPAYNGQEAVDAIRDGLRPEIILMDQEMPILSGDGAARAIRKLEQDGRGGHIPILGVSANVREEQKSSMRAAGMDEVLSKPFKVDELVRRIQSLLPSP